MSKKAIGITLLLLILILLAATFFRVPVDSNVPVVNEGISLLPATNDGAYAVADEQWNFVFPRDLGAHPQFQTEWWYYTGNLFDQTGRHFGYQLTFFRRALRPDPQIGRTSSWATNQVYLAHFTLTDVLQKQHYQKETISRGALGLAGVEFSPNFQVNLFDWAIRQTDESHYELKAESEDYSIQLLLQDEKGFILNGDEGLSKKGAQIGEASYYFSQTRLKSNGTVTISGRDFQVSGNSWMDHEFGSSTLGSSQIGWDWFSLQMDNNQELMLFQIREEDGSISSTSGGTLIAGDGSSMPLKQMDFEIQVLQNWKTDDGFTYPSKWRVISKTKDFDLFVTPVMDDQENRFFFRYWEGAVRIEGTYQGQNVAGYGYVELTGYAQSMQGVF